MAEEREFHQKFIQFPSSFSLEIEELSQSKYLDSHKRALTLKCETKEFETVTECIRIYNLLSFLHWIEDDQANAYKHNKKVLDLEKENIIALCNRVWMQRKCGHLTEADEKLNEVKKLAASKQDLLLQGQAEIAYSYSAFGPRYFSQSIKLYNQLLTEVVDKDTDPKLLLLWKLDLGIAYRKFCNPGNLLSKQDWRERSMDDCIEKAALLFHEVINSDSPARWKGQCFASLAEFAFSIFTEIHGTKSQRELFPKEIASTTVDKFLNLALGACDNDSHVLKVCGKLFKYFNQLDRAEEILRKSICIMDTSYGHHHLALVLKKKLMKRMFDAKAHNRKGIDKNSTNSLMKGKIVRPSRDSKCNQQGQETTRNFPIRRLQSQEPSNNSFKKEAAKAFSHVVNIPAYERDSVEEIMTHLDKAIEFGNEWASFEKGLMFRQIKEHKKAFETFIKTLNMKDLRTAATVTVACYEHLGACSRDLAQGEIDPENKRKLEADAIKYFRKAVVTSACNASQELRYLRDGWMAYPTLKDMFQPQKRDIEKLKVFAELSRLLGKYGDTLDFYEKIIELDDTQSNDPEIIRGQIQILIKEGHFEQAAVLLDLQSCTEGKYKITEEFCKSVYLKCAFHLLSTDKKEDSGQRFRQAFYVASADKPKAEPDFDIFFLYDEENETQKPRSKVQASALANNLKDILGGISGLRITSNSESLLPGSLKLDSQTKQMNSSSNIILILDTNEELQGELKYFIQIAKHIDLEKKSKLCLITIDGCTCPLELTGCLRVDFKTILMQRQDDFFLWAQSFLYRLLGITKSEE
ncbi:hypothetical protein CHS0354_035440 [Potamilus streckersoni]|uniref:Uncharacterized protein n=1 Tax=Potamilus streckersoni TaxID=2493646 RepID=A0AAE0TEI6_9BIVA|nr:hypothetical protein CHS0354_035440 [Potamilus streckersoni]